MTDRPLAPVEEGAKEDGFAEAQILFVLQLQTALELTAAPEVQQPPPQRLRPVEEDVFSGRQGDGRAI